MGQGRPVGTWDLAALQTLLPLRLDGSNIAMPIKARDRGLVHAIERLADGLCDRWIFRHAADGFVMENGIALPSDVNEPADGLAKCLRRQASADDRAMKVGGKGAQAHPAVRPRLVRLDLRL